MSYPVSPKSATRWCLGAAAFTVSQAAPQGALHRIADQRKVEQLPCDKLAEEMYRRLIEKMAEDQGVTEKLKGVRPMEWIRKMSNIHACASEIVNSKLVLHSLKIGEDTLIGIFALLACISDHNAFKRQTPCYTRLFKV